MKNQLLIAAALLCVGNTLLAQGTINFANRVAGKVSAPIYNVDPACNNGPRKSGNPSAAELGFPAGTTVYGGSKLTGTGYSAQLWVGPDMNHLIACTAPGGATPLTSTFRTGSSAGLLITTTASAPGIDVGTSVIAVIRVWDNLGGTFTCWAQAISGSSSNRGESDPVSIVLGGISAGGVIFTNPDLVGLTSFELEFAAGCPEPSVIALGLVGIGALLFARRK